MSETEETIDYSGFTQSSDIVGYGAMFAGIAGAVATIIYAMKHVKSSSCLGSRCEQDVVIEVPVARPAFSTQV